MAPGSPSSRLPEAIATTPTPPPGRRSVPAARWPGEPRAPPAAGRPPASPTSVLTTPLIRPNRTGPLRLGSRRSDSNHVHPALILGGLHHRYTFAVPARASQWEKRIAPSSHGWSSCAPQAVKEAQAGVSAAQTRPVLAALPVLAAALAAAPAVSGATRVPGPRLVDAALALLARLRTCVRRAGRHPWAARTCADRSVVTETVPSRAACSRRTSRR
jgi:hypothetical protein